MKIIQISDCHLFADIHKVGYAGINPHNSLRQILDEVAALQPDLLCFTGDISGDGSAKSYQAFAELLECSKIDCHFYVLPGNHDDENHMEQTFSAQHLWINHSHFAIGKNWHIHLLNTKHIGNLGKISDKSLDDLRRQLVCGSHSHNLVFTHHHPIECGGWMDKHEWLNRHEFTNLVNEFSCVKGVAYGHVHVDIEQYINSCLYMACPSTCWQWECTRDFAVSHLKPGYRVINLMENGEIKTSVARIK